MFKMNKKLMIPVLAMVLVVAMAGNAFALMVDNNYGRFVWGDEFDLQERDYEDTYQTYLIQRALNIIDGASLYVDGDFGPGTESAVLAFQMDYADLTNDGIVGENTWNGLQSKRCWECYFLPSYDEDLGLDYHNHWKCLVPPAERYDYIRQYETGRWRVQRGNGDWRWAK